MSTQKAAAQQPLLQAIDLKKHYPVKKGMFAPERLVKALDGGRQSKCHYPLDDAGRPTL